MRRTAGEPAPRPNVHTGCVGLVCGGWMPRAENKNRYLLAAAVAGLHIVLVIVFIETQSLADHPYAEPAAAMMVFLTMRRRPRAFPAAAPLEQAPLIAPITAPITPLMISPGRNAFSIEVPRPIDWIAAAKRAVATILARKTKRALGFPKGASPYQALKGSSADSGPRAGESYRTHTGQRVAWVGRHCYVVSNPPLLGESQIQRQAQMSSVGCRASGGSAASERFVERLRAYGRYRRELVRRYKVNRHPHGP